MDIPLNTMSSQLAPSSLEQERQILIILMDQLCICNYAMDEYWGGTSKRDNSKNMEFTNLLVSVLGFMLYDIIINLKTEASPIMLLCRKKQMCYHQIALVWCYHQDSNPASPLHYLCRVKQVFVHLLFIFSWYYGIVFLTCVISWLSLGQPSFVTLGLGKDEYKPYKVKGSSCSKGTGGHWRSFNVAISSGDASRVPRFREEAPTQK